MKKKIIKILLCLSIFFGQCSFINTASAMMIFTDDDIYEYDGDEIKLSDDDKSQVESLLADIYDMLPESYELMLTSETSTPVLLVCFEDKVLDDNLIERASIIVNNLSWITNTNYELKEEFRLGSWVTAKEKLKTKKYWSFDINDKCVELKHSSKMSYGLAKDILLAIDSDKIVNKEELEDDILDVENIDFIIEIDEGYLISIGTCMYNSYQIEFAFIDGNVVIKFADELMIS